MVRFLWRDVTQVLVADLLGARRCLGGELVCWLVGFGLFERF